MKKLIEWLKYSNNYKHLFSCMGVAIICGFVPAMFMGVGVEVKDSKWSGKFNWKDVWVDFIGAFIGTIIRFIFIQDWLRLLC